MSKKHDPKTYPWFKLWAPDFLADPGLMMCSDATQIFWVRLMCLMHLGDPYGHLAVGGVAIPVAHLGPLANAINSEVDNYLAQLLRNGVAQQTDDGMIYCPKLIRDRDYSLERQGTGKLGGNPNILKLVPKKDQPET